MISRARAFLTDERGQDLVEYSLLLTIIGLVVIVYLTGVGTNVISILSKVGARLNSADGSIQ
jgi:Flp pilus assembly pilin Flp